MSCFPAGGGLYKFPLPTGDSFNVPPFESWESLTSQVSGAFWKVPPTSYLLRLPVSILSAGPQGFSPFSSPNTRSGSRLPLTSPPFSTCPPRSLHSRLPPPLVIAFFFLPSGTDASSIGHFSLLSFLSSVDSILGILYDFIFYFLFG